MVMGFSLLLGSARDGQDPIPKLDVNEGAYLVIPLRGVLIFLDTVLEKRVDISAVHDEVSIDES